MSTYKVLLVGDASVGKTTYVKRLLTGEFQKEYLPTVGVDNYSLPFHTTRGLITFSVFDCSGEPRDEQYLNTKCVIVIYDCLSAESLSGVNCWIDRIRGKCGDIPIVVCANKYDVKGQHFHKQRKEMQWLISAKSNYNFEKPFQYLMRELENCPDLELVSFPAVAPPLVTSGADQPSLMAEFSREDDDEDHFEAAKSNVCAALCDMAEYAKKIHSGPIVPFLMEHVIPMIRELEDK